MAEITLRDYVKFVDQLIEREKLDEAIAHCRYILESYPKHLDVYRLLGKAYLEAKRYGDSADIFQRVLSAVPDDFVAHIGMAIVREDEGNLDAAIWHMERAFETNPANPAIQQELKRLIGRRDGLEPHKVRLTRGALARMYAHGDLFPQAIAELRSALQEDADRPDLQVLLAEMYWRTEQRAEAAEVCNQVLQKLPYCREANRILAAILHASGKVDEAAAYHRRLAALDPYAAYVENVTVDPGTVDANSMRLERLEWQAGRPLPAAPAPAPDWASSLGLGAEESPAELAESAGTPAWLASAGEMPTTQEEQPQPEPTEQAVQPFAAPEPEAEEIPEWMAEAGWSPATGQAQEGPVSFSDEEMSSLESGMPMGSPAEEPEEVELAPAEIPDWLQDKAPPAEDFLSEAETPEPSFPSGEGPPDWMSAFEEEARRTAPEPGGISDASDRTPTEPEGFGEGELDLQFGAESQQAPIGAERDEEAPAIPTWLEEVTPGATSTIVTWLGDRAKEGAKAPGEGGMPSWMEQAASEEFEGSAGEAEPEAEAEAAEGPSWLEEVGEASDALFGDETADEAAAPGPSPTPAWLFGVAEAAAQEPSPDLDEVSEYLQEAQPEIPPEEPFEAPEEAPAPMQAAAPDWLKAIASSEEGPLQEPAFEEAPVDESSTDWLRGLATETGEPSPEPAAPDWLEGLAEGTPPGDVEPAAEMDWLEGLGEPAEEAPPSAAVPDWLDGLGATGAAAMEEQAEAPSAFEEPALAEPEAPAVSSADQIPGWLEDFGTPAEEEVEEAAVGGGAAFLEETQEGAGLDWLEGEATSAEEPAMEAALPMGAEEPAPGEFPSGQVDDDEVFRWLEDLASKQGDEAEPIEATAIGTGSLGEAQEPAIRSDVEFPEEPGEGLEWLERLASERGLPEEEEEVEEAFFEEEAPSAEPETAPEWMLDTEAEAEAEAVSELVEQADEDEALRWLEEMAQGEPSEPSEPQAAMTPEEEISAPEWLITMAAEEEEPAESEMPTALPSEMAEEEGLGWLEEMAGETERVTELPADSFPAADELEWTEFEQPQVPLDGGVSEFILSELEEQYEEAAPLPAAEPTPPSAIEEPDEEEVLEWLTRMSAESNQALQESQAESEQAPEELAQGEQAGIELEMPEAPIQPEPEAPAPAPASPEWLRIPAEDIPAPRAAVPPTEWPLFEAGVGPSAPAPEAQTPLPPAPPAAEVPPAPPVPPPTPPAAEVPPAQLAAEVPPTPPAPPPAPPAAEIPPAPPAPTPVPPAAEVPLAPPAPPPAPPAAEIPSAPPAPPPAPPAAEIPPAPPAPTPVPPAAEIPPAPPAPTPVPPAAEIPPAPPAPPPAPPVAEVPPAPPAPPPTPPAAEVPPAASTLQPTPPAAEAPPAPPPSKPPKKDPGQILESARNALAGGEVDEAVKTYSSLIKRRSQLPSIIADLKAAVELDPDAAGLWQVLGDAYMKNDQVNDAIEAYRRGMEVA
jgi:tetratricopeptide (TPR) repeat protein